MTDAELTAEARRIAVELFARSSSDDLARSAAGHLRALADRLDAIPDAATEVHAMLAENYGRERDAGNLDPDNEVRRRIRAERLLIFDRLIALAAQTTEATDGPRGAEASGAVGGEFGNHKRWHVSRGEHNPACRYCQAATKRGGGIPEGSDGGHSL